MKFISLITLLILSSCQSSKPKSLGLIDGNLTSCPTSPNCVNSMIASNSKHQIDPIKYQLEKKEQILRLKNYLLSRDDSTLIKENENYLHYEFKSAIFGFIDDVEFLFEDNIIHVRSASRVGYSDLGKNRSRIEEIRFKIYQNEI